MHLPPSASRADADGGSTVGCAAWTRGDSRAFSRARGRRPHRYDGNTMERNPTHVSPRVRTSYSLPPEEADDRIALLVRQALEQRQKVVVVSSDRATLGIRLPEGVVQLDPLTLRAHAGDIRLSKERSAAGTTVTSRPTSSASRQRTVKPGRPGRSGSGRGAGPLRNPFISGARRWPTPRAAGDRRYHAARAVGGSIRGGPGTSFTAGSATSSVAGGRGVISTPSPQEGARAREATARLAASPAGREAGAQEKAR